MVRSPHSLRVKLTVDDAPSGKSRGKRKAQDLRDAESYVGSDAGDSSGSEDGDGVDSAVDMNVDAEEAEALTETGSSSVSTSSCYLLCI
jgi:hypothetical protein